MKLQKFTALLLAVLLVLAAVLRDTMEHSIRKRLA